jgi:ketosteroid isomerase-like protein
MIDRSSSPAEIARSYFAAFDSRDPVTIARHVSDDFVNEHTAALGTGCVGRDEYRRRLSGFLDSMPGLHYTIESTVVDGEQVAVFYTMTGRFQGDAPFEVRGAQRLVIRDGLITSRTDYWDSAAFMLQVDDNAAATLRSLGMT